jgi:DNA-directed RNA polymerase subunit N (RpoN/RPB10)
MIIPVRCFSCGKVNALHLHREPRKKLTKHLSRTQVVGDLWTRYVKLIEEGGPEGKGIDEGYV